MALFTQVLFVMGATSLFRTYFNFLLSLFQSLFLEQPAPLDFVLILLFSGPESAIAESAGELVRSRTPLATARLA